MRRIDELPLRHPFAGARMVPDLLWQEELAIGRRHVATLLPWRGLEALYRQPRLSRRPPAPRTYPSLLRDLAISHPNQFWATDITYSPMARGFVYVCAGLGGQAAELAYRFSDSSDLYEMGRRRPHASINFVTAHEGFTLHDLTSYNEKHNKANGEGNRDGTDDNLSSNCGAEGPTDNPAITELRDRQTRNMLATLILSQGVPMICGGDDISRTQWGNNNTYCQDNELSWFDWKLNRRDHELLALTHRLISLRLEHAVLRRRQFFQSRHIRGSAVKDRAWFRPDGKEMTDDDWNQGYVRSLGLRLAGDAIEEMDENDRPILDDTLLVLLNAHHEPVPFILPAHKRSIRWQMILDTATPKQGKKPRALREVEPPYHLHARSLAILQVQKKPTDENLSSMKPRA